MRTWIWPAYCIVASAALPLEVIVIWTSPMPTDWGLRLALFASIGAGAIWNLYVLVTIAVGVHTLMGVEMGWGNEIEFDSFPPLPEDGEPYYIIESVDRDYSPLCDESGAVRLIRPDALGTHVIPEGFQLRRVR